MGVGAQDSGAVPWLACSCAVGHAPLVDLQNKPPLHPRVVTGYHNVARRFFEGHGFRNVKLLSADGALEAAPAMGFADIILDLVSSGVTLRENNLREIAGGRVLASQGVLVANRRALLERPGLLGLVHELLERLDAHLLANEYYSVIANMRGESPEEVAALLLSSELLGGLQGPTVSPVYTRGPSGPVQHGFYGAQICVPKRLLYPAVKEIRKVRSAWWGLDERAERVRCPTV